MSLSLFADITLVFKVGIYNDVIDYLGVFIRLKFYGPEF